MTVDVLAAARLAAADRSASARNSSTRVGDPRRSSELGISRRALALYYDAKPEAVAETRRVFAQKSTPVSNNPDDVPLLQELSAIAVEESASVGLIENDDGTLAQVNRFNRSDCP